PEGPSATLAYRRRARRPAPGGGLRVPAGARCDRGAGENRAAPGPGKRLPSRGPRARPEHVPRATRLLLLQADGARLDRPRGVLLRLLARLCPRAQVDGAPAPQVPPAPGGDHRVPVHDVWMSHVSRLCVDLG